jgi:hypothetical protein
MTKLGDKNIINFLHAEGSQTKSVSLGVVKMIKFEKWQIISFIKRLDLLSHVCVCVCVVVWVGGCVGGWLWVGGWMWVGGCGLVVGCVCVYRWVC